MFLNRKGLFLVITLLLVIGVGLFVRFHKLNEIYQKKDIYFYGEKNDKPILGTMDAYLYLRYAKNFDTGEFKPSGIDKYRNAPENFLPDVDKKDIVRYPPIIPLNSLIINTVSKLTKENLDKVAAFLAPVLAVLVAIPLILLFFRKNLFITALSSSTLATVSFLYVNRTYFARPDTDTLNLFFPFTLVYLFYLFIESPEYKKIKLSILAFLIGAFMFLYYWWYFHANVILLMFVTFLFVLFISKWKIIRRREFFKFYGMPLAIILFTSGLLIYGLEAIVTLVNTIRLYLVHTKAIEEDSIVFPNVFQSIDELQHLSLSSLAFYTVGNEIMLFLGFLGLILFSIKFWRLAILLAPIFAIGLLAFKGAHRFAIYLAPFVGIGFGYLIDLLIKFVREENRYKVFLLSYPLVFAILLFLNLPSFKHIYKPIVEKNILNDFLKQKEGLLKKSWIWTWWDFGYSIQYVSEKTTYLDGGNQVSPKTYFVAYSFTTSNPINTYYTIKGLSYLGTDKFIDLRLKQKKSLREINQSLKIIRKRNIYLMFTKDQMGKFGWISYFGSWDFDKKTGKRYLLKSLRGCKTVSSYIISCSDININTKQGFIVSRVTLKTTPLSKVVFRTDRVLKVKNFRSKNGPVFEVVSRNGKTLFLLLDQNAYNSVFNKMFILKQYNPRLFAPIYDNFPYTVIFQVLH